MPQDSRFRASICIALQKLLLSHYTEPAVPTPFAAPLHMGAQVMPTPIVPLPTLPYVYRPCPQNPHVLRALTRSTTHVFSHEETPLSRILSFTRQNYPEVTISCTSSNEVDWAIIQGQLLLSSSLPYPSYNPRVILSWSQTEQEVNVTFEVNLVPIKQAKCGSDVLELFQMVETLLPTSGFVLCQGLDEKVAEEATFDCKNVRKWGFPFNRMDHIDCVMWFQRPPDSTINRCGKCRDLGYYLKKEVQRRKSVTPERKARRVLPSSKYPISKLTPVSQRTRIDSIRKARSKLQLKVKSSQKLLETSVNNVTHGELIELVSKIQRTSKDQLERLMAEADAAGKGDLLREAWKQDVEDRRAFDKDQHGNGENDS